MRKNSLRVLLVSLLSLSIGACATTNHPSDNLSSLPSNDSSNESQPNMEEMPKLATDFLSNLAKVQSVTLESKDQLNLCLMLYKALEDYSSSLLLDERIVEGKELLDSYLNTYNQLKDEFEKNEEYHALANAFIQQMNALPSANLITLEDYDALLLAQKAYEQLTNEIQNLEEIKIAKEQLDQSFAQYEWISNMSQDEYQAYKFISSIALLPAIEELSISDITTIDEISTLYNNLSSANKNDEAIIQAYQKFSGYESRCNELKTSLAKAESFMTKAFSLPSSGALKYQNSEQQAQINQAFAAYDALTEEEKLIPGVADAYQELLAVKEAFDSLLEPYAISRLGYGWNFQTGELVFTSGRDPITMLTTNYGLTTANLKDNVIVYLDLYFEAGAVVGNMLYSFDITENYKITVEDVKKVLIQLRDDGNAKAVSGAGYNFTLHIVSLNEQYANSEYTGFFGGQKISF